MPVEYDFKQSINEVKTVKTSNWRKSHYNSLVVNYSKAPYFKDYEPFFKATYGQTWEKLADLNIHFIKFLAQAFGIGAKLIKSSELKVDLCRTERLVEICKRLKADTYLSGVGAKAYLDLELFNKSGIKVIFQDFKHPDYLQAYPGFEPAMSAIDLLFNYGKRSLEILKGEQQ